MIVVDACVAVKWLLSEEGAESARELLLAPEPLCMPSHGRIEVVGALLRRHREGLLSEEETRQCCALWQDVLGESVRLLDFAELMERATSIAFRCQHTLTDCLYVAAAQQTGGPLITADRRLHARCRKEHRDIRLLGSAVLN